MNIKILSVGKIKESFYKEAISEYQKRLSRYCNFKIIEVADEKTKENATQKEIDIVLEKESDRIINHIKDNDYVISLAIEGKKMDSVQFADKINSLGVNGVSDICFIIGGSLGLHRDVLSKSDMLLSFSDMTFPHQLMRVILSEQIYRAFRIINHEPYHK
ncbi:MAG: 23S rRNA (pseudouridine(1915)-N(3))-methyltransferase RlmH [Lachnospiraceae bacterium]|nr:23S rRNA (pseudouridine(1915)-N(3))-methyltransferase RlmH [Lachnospiraceae bacterium]